MTEHQQFNLRWVWMAAVGVTVAILFPARAVRAEDAKKESEPTAEQTEFFEKKIRPVLVERCYNCHSHKSKKVKGEYYLDSRDAIRKGGESGKPAIVPGESDKSPFMGMIKRTDPDKAMPPKEKDALTPEQVKDFEHWIKDGAPDPRKEADKSEPDKKASADDALPPDAKAHWAFQKPVEPVAPAVKDAGWVKNPIDTFVLAKLESKNMAPAPQATKATLIRRASLSLVGTPPAPEEVAAFEADASPDAFAKVIDRLLASPHYGERWGRYWLDVARYADTKGYVFNEDRNYPNAFTYRDYVIRSFNDDLPYDQFLIQQIAADRLDLKGDTRPLAALGFLTVGRRFLNNQQDVIDDRIDVVTRGTMALTVQCARCHDHKFDPIPTADYYSLYGVFNSSVEPAELPVLGTSEQTTASRAFDIELKTRQASANAYLNEQANKLLVEFRTPKVLADHLMAGQFKDTPAEGAYLAGVDVRKMVIKRWGDFLKKSVATSNPVFVAWNAYAAVAPDQFAALSQEITAKLFGEATPAKPMNSFIVEAFKGKPAPASMREVADRYAAAIVAQDRLEAYPEPEKEALREIIQGEKSPIYFVNDEWIPVFARDITNKYRELKKSIDELRSTDPGAPPLAMVMLDKPNPGDTPVFKRGNPGMPGAIAPRRFLECVAGPDRKPFTDGSGRLELARAIASADNPLTARVMVNRVWMNQFGTPLVRTPSDFGVRTERPVQAEVLDYLALRFIEGGWSIKKLQRTLMLSATWQQASDNTNAEYAVADPENNLLWRHNRRRMDFESMRDSWLAVAGHLDPTVGGKAVDIIDAKTDRRTIYGFVDRQNLPGEFRTFDFASPDTHSAGRFMTSVPQQALFMLNSPFIERVTRETAARKDVAEQGDLAQKTDRLYRTLFARAATADEVEDAGAFIASEQVASDVSKNSPWQYGIARYESSSDRMIDFKRLGQFAGDKWIPRDEEIKANGKLKFAMLTAAGGHPGADKSVAVVRRWIAPADGVVNIGGTLGHKNDKSDGIAARIVSNRVGQISSWKIANLEAATNVNGLPVQKGDTIDFVVEPRENNTFDQFAWAPSIRLTRPQIAGAAGAEGVIESDAQREFSGNATTPLSPWEKYAQVLLLSNEFMFID